VLFSIFEQVMPVLMVLWNMSKICSDDTRRYNVGRVIIVLDRSTVVRVYKLLGPLPAFV